MDIFSVLSLVGGLALFLYGMNAMGDGLSKMAGGKLESILERLTSKRIFALLLGAGVTAIIQSSSATTVMVVGFVNSGIMHLSQAVGIIMGANIGTTMTAWLLSLTGIQGENLLIQMLKPSTFSPVLAAIGIILTMTSKGEGKKKDVGTILLGFAILMFGMEAMSDAVAPLAENEKFTSILTAFSNPILGMLAGLILTAVIQSSSASVGILQALCTTGVVSFGVAIPIIMGQNIGTCVTALISSVGANKNAKRAAMIHLFFNLIGTILFMVVFYSINAFVDFAFLSDTADAAGIAIVHSLFNIGCCIVFFPFADWLVKLATFAVSEKVVEGSTIAVEDEISIDERFMERPAFAMEICRNMMRKMADETQQAIRLALEVLENYDEDKANEVYRLEDRSDRYEDELGSYLVKLSGKNLSISDSHSLSVILHGIGNLERIADHAINVVESAKEMKDKQLEFSEAAKEEVRVLSKAVNDIMTRTMLIGNRGDSMAAMHIEPLEEVIDGLIKVIKQNHIKRLRKAACTIEMGLVFEDLLINLERISDHCSNIAVELITIEGDTYDIHELFRGMSEREREAFDNEYRKFKEKYIISEESEELTPEELAAEARRLETAETEQNDSEKKKIKKEKKEKKDKSEKKKKDKKKGRTDSSWH